MGFSSLKKVLKFIHSIEFVHATSTDSSIRSSSAVMSSGDCTLRYTKIFVSYEEFESKSSFQRCG